jgi:hypothetical protein
MLSALIRVALIPLLTGLVWLSGIFALLGIWSAEGHPQYAPGEGSIVYISDVGAHILPLFISISFPNSRELKL